jgi:hypothetical protein
MHILSPECMARKLPRFDRDHPSIADKLVLPDWTQSNRTVWPQQSSRRDMSMFAPPAYDPRYSADWSSSEVQAEREAAAQRENERIARYHEQQSRIQEGRLNREGR